MLKDHNSFTIQSCKNQILHFFRFHKTAEDCLDFLKEQGYRIETILQGEKEAGMPYDKEKEEQIKKLEDKIIEVEQEWKDTHGKETTCYDIDCITYPNWQVKAIRDNINKLKNSNAITKI